MLFYYARALIVFCFVILGAVVMAGCGEVKGNTPHIALHTEGFQTIDPFEYLAEREITHAEAQVYTVIVDPGHGGEDPGAVGASGVEEKDYTYTVAQMVYDLLEQEVQFKPVLSRGENDFLNPEARAQFANVAQADALISIHGNTFTDPWVSGTEVLYSREDDSKRLAEVLQQQIVKAMGFRDRGIKEEELKLLTQTFMPAALIEVGYLTNEAEETIMLSEDGMRRTAQAIVEGLKQFFAIEMKADTASG